MDEAFNSSGSMTGGWTCAYCGALVPWNIPHACPTKINDTPIIVTFNNAPSKYEEILRDIHGELVSIRQILEKE